MCILERSTQIVLVLWNELKKWVTTIIISHYNLLINIMPYLQIPVMADLPVGDNLQDHILMGVTFNDRTNSAGAALPSMTTMLQYLIFRSGQWLLWWLLVVRFLFIKELISLCFNMCNNSLIPEKDICYEVLISFIKLPK